MKPRLGMAAVTLTIPMAIVLALVLTSHAVYVKYGLPWYLGFSLDANLGSAKVMDISWILESILVAVLARHSARAGYLVASSLWCFPTLVVAALSLLAGDHRHHENIFSCAIIAVYGWCALFPVTFLVRSATQEK